MIALPTVWRADAVSDLYHSTGQECSGVHCDCCIELVSTWLQALTWPMPELSGAMKLWRES